MIDQFIRWHETKFYKSYLIEVAKKIVNIIFTTFCSIYKKTKLIDFVHFWCGRNQHFAQLSPIRMTLSISFRDIRKELSIPLQWNLPTIGRILSHIRVCIGYCWQAAGHLSSVYKRGLGEIKNSMHNCMCEAVRNICYNL